MIDITSTAIATIIAVIISTMVTLFINRSNRRQLLDQQLNDILKLAIQYPYLVGIAHQESIQPTYEESRYKNEGIQEPDASLPKCLSEQQLIISINPKRYVRP